jgi:uncharacterized RDD family membrane protein YckC
MAQPPIIIENQPPWADPWSHPAYFAGITVQRIIAYAIDVVVIALLATMLWIFLMVLGFLTLGLAWTLLWLPAIFLPLSYHILFIAGPHSATPGMRVMGIRVMSLDPQAQDGGRPNLFQAIIQTVAFYGSVATTGSLILLVALFNTRRRTLHDWLAGTVVVNAFPPESSRVL